MNAAEDKKQVLEMVEKYRQSVIGADRPELAGSVWLCSPEASFIHPRGHERGWDEVRENFYGKTMNGLFASRDLGLTSEPEVSIYGDVALVEFCWAFEAVSRADGSVRNTAGRESQAFLKILGKGWRLAKVHYSGPPQS